MTKCPNASVGEHRHDLDEGEGAALLRHVHTFLQQSHAGREAVGPHDLAVERERGVPGVVPHLKAVVEEEERAGIRELPRPLAPAADPPDQRAFRRPDRHLQGLHVEHVNPGAVGCRAHVQDPAEERIALQLVADFILRFGGPVLDGGERRQVSAAVAGAPDLHGRGERCNRNDRPACNVSLT